MPGTSGASAIPPAVVHPAQSLNPEQKFLSNVENNKLTFTEIHQELANHPNFLKPLITGIAQRPTSSMLSSLFTLMNFYKNDLKGGLASLVGNPANRLEPDPENPANLIPCARLTNEQQQAFIELIAMPEHARTIDAFERAGVIRYLDDERDDETWPIFEKIAGDDSLYLWLKRGLPGPDEFRSGHTAPIAPNCSWYPINMRYANLENLYLHSHDFSSCDMRRANLEHAELYKCGINGSNLEGATVQGISMEKCNGNLNV